MPSKKETGLPSMKANTGAGSIALLFGEVNEEVAQDIVSWILACNMEELEDRPESLTLMINSPGGCVHSAFSIIEVMNGSSIPVSTVGLGQVSSAGLLIFMSGAKGQRLLTPTCSVLSHTFSTGIAGNFHGLINMNKELGFMHQRIIDQYKRCTGLAEKVITEKLLNPQDSWLTPQEAVNFKLADGISKL